MGAPALSPRELEVVRLRATGLTVDEVGLRLGLAYGTVRHHLRSAITKADAGSFLELLGALGWVTIPDRGVSIAEVRHERLLWRRE